MHAASALLPQKSSDPEPCAAVRLVFFFKGFAKGLLIIVSGFLKGYVSFLLGFLIMLRLSLRVVLLKGFIGCL